MNLVEEIRKRIILGGLEILQEKEIILSEVQFDLIYGHLKNSLPEIYLKMKNYLTTNKSLIVKVSGENCVRRLLKIRGSSNPVDSLPGTIRGDYAKEQDYHELRKIGKISKNVFHAADSEQEALNLLSVLFGDKNER